MPPLSQMIRSSSPPGFGPAEDNAEAPPVQVDPGRPLGGNPYLRCPLPPFNAGVDTLRQFNEGGKVPTRRVIPLPIATQVGGGTTINNTEVTNQGGSGGGGGGTTPATLTSLTVTQNVPALAPGATYRATLIMAKSFQLLLVTSTQAVEIRLYGDSITQGGDIARVTDTAVPFEVVPGIITDVVFDVAPFIWRWQNRIGANADSVQTKNIYLTVVNPSQIIGTPATTISIQYLPLES